MTENNELIIGQTYLSLISDTLELKIIAIEDNNYVVLNCGKHQIISKNVLESAYKRLEIYQKLY